MQPSSAHVAIPTAPAAPGAIRQTGPNTYSATAVYEGYAAQRRVLGEQLEQLQGLRNDLSDRLQDPMVAGANRVGLEGRITGIDQRIATLDTQIAAVDAQLAQSAAVPGAVVPKAIDSMERRGPPREVWVLSGIFMIVCVLPISLAFARRVVRRGAAAIAALPHDLMDRVIRLDQSVESIAIEVERIGEGQRFMTRLFSEVSARPVGAGTSELIEPLNKVARGTDGIR